ncbi:MAG: PepSY-associated TM helix domain-containing protein [Thiopseudomonas sp.]
MFSLTGLWLLVRQAGRQAWTWPLTLAGALVPLLLMVLFIH